MLRYLIAALTLALGLIAAEAHAQTVADITRGRPYTIFHGEFSVADATDATLTMESQHRFTLYADGSTTALALAPTDQIVVESLMVCQIGTTTLASVYDGADLAIDAGETLLKNNRVASLPYPLVRPHYCQKGTYLKLKAGAAGQVDAVARGIIIHNN